MPKGLQFRSGVFGLLGAAMLLLVPSACSLGETILSSSAIESKVLQEGTNKPIVGAIVIVRWAGTVGGIGHSSGMCYHVESAVSNAEGTYRTPAWKKPSPYGDITHPRKSTIAYRPGYAYSREQDAVVYLEPFTGTQEERLAHLERIIQASSCDQAGKARKQLYRLYASVYEEAKSLVTTPTDERLRWIRWQAAYASIARDERMTQREVDRLIDEHLRDHLK